MPLGRRIDADRLEGECHPLCGAGAVLFGWDGLLGSHSSRCRLEIYKKRHTTQEQEMKDRIKNGWRKKMDSHEYL